MSGFRGFTPIAVAITFGVFTGYYTFQPAFREELERHKGVGFDSRQVPSSQRGDGTESSQVKTNNQTHTHPEGSQNSYITTMWSAQRPLPRSASAEEQSQSHERVSSTTSSSSISPSWAKWPWSK